MAWFNPAVLATGNSVTATIWNDNFSNMADSGWIAISGFTNSWASLTGPASSYTVAGYRLIGNMVHLGGVIGSGVAGDAAFTLPSGYRPPYGLRVVCSITSGASYLSVSTAGVVTPASNASPSMDGIMFTID